MTVFQINSKCDSATIAELSETLSVEESQRSTRFRSEDDRRRFIVTRGSLRELLGSVLNREPKTLVISYARSGKPFLNEISNQVYFNVSHSRDVSLIAMSKSKVLGIDVEFLADGHDFLRVAKRVFSPEQFDVFYNSATASDFYTLWTRREAIVKALGTGLSDPRGLQCLPGKNGYFQPTNLRFPDLDGECSVVSIPIDDEYRAALTWINARSEVESL